jgi:hypothetical protein
MLIVIRRCHVHSERVILQRRIADHRIRCYWLRLLTSGPMELRFSRTQRFENDRAVIASSEKFDAIRHSLA